MNHKPSTLIAALCLALSMNACAAPKKPEAQPAPPATAQGPVATFLQGCQSELDAYCKAVTPGEKPQANFAGCGREAIMP